MNGLDIQANLDAVVTDLQTKGKGQSVEFMFRNADNSSNVLVLSSNSAGVVNAAQLATVQAFVDVLKTAADAYSTQNTPLSLLREDYKTTRAVHQTLIDASAAARENLAEALANDIAFDEARQALEAARIAPAYVAAVAEFKEQNASENIAEISRAKGSYLV